MKFLHQMTYVLILQLTITLFSTAALADTPEHSERYFAPQGIAIKGYDTVSYFTKQQAQLGKAQYSHQWQGVTWYFINVEHLALFKAAPQQYAPQFGGFCALGAAHFGAVPTDPSTFSLHKNKLYLNMTPPVAITWRLNPDFHIERAIRAWQEGSITFY